MKFCFGDIVIVLDGLIGVVLKRWETSFKQEYWYSVYVEEFDEIRSYREDQLKEDTITHKSSWLDGQGF